MPTLGSDQATLKDDAEEGSVELTIDDTTYTRLLTRTDGSIMTKGDPYLNDAELADLFALFLDSLEAIDSNRIVTLFEYFNEYVGYLVTALLTRGRGRTR
ncbi:hypothetical protein GCM10009000_061570 [Halobacterium noricense]|uniref:Uncharacterized protein n=1 Tax=Haladaptatus pallidirubidus TaxID=1008152 RepID=A0AAV3UJ94_9EURY